MTTDGVRGPDGAPGPEGAPDSADARADALWARLGATGVVAGHAPHAHAGLPWYLAGLTGVAAWIAALLLFGFFAALLDDLWRTPGIAAVAGTVCVAGALALLRAGRDNDFLEQAAIAVSVAGQLLLGMAVVDWFDDGGWALVAAIALALYAFGAQPMHRFVCAVAFAFAIAVLCAVIDPASGASVCTLPVLAWLAWAMWWRLAGDDADAGGALSPMAWALALAALCVAMIGGGATFVRGPGSVQSWLAWVAMVPLLPATAWRLAGPPRLPTVLCALALALLWLRAPGVSLGLALALIGFAHHRPALLATGLLGTGVYLLRYYYHLDVSLLAKSLWLLAGGTVLLAARAGVAHVAAARARGATGSAP